MIGITKDHRAQSWRDADEMSDPPAAAATGPSLLSSTAISGTTGAVCRPAFDERRDRTRNLVADEIPTVRRDKSTVDGRGPASTCDE